MTRRIPPPGDDPFGARKRSLFLTGPSARNTDPETSHGAKKWRLNEDRIAVLHMHAMKPSGMTDFELAAYMGRQQTSVGVRRGELRDHGYVRDTGLRRPAPSGSSSIVWSITVDGILLDKELQRGRT
jgi:hypothetical protein